MIVRNGWFVWQAIVQTSARDATHRLGRLALCWRPQVQFRRRIVELRTALIVPIGAAFPCVTAFKKRSRHCATEKFKTLS
jgi:hypothetical protein